MDCRTAHEAMDAWLGESLPEARIRSLKRHLGRCSDCAAEWNRRQGGLNALAAASEPPSIPESESLWHAVEEKLSEREPPARNAVPDRTLWLPVAAAVAILALAVGWSHQVRVPARPGLEESAERWTAPDRHIRFATGMTPDPRVRSRSSVDAPRSQPPRDAASLEQFLREGSDPFPPGFFPPFEERGPRPGSRD